MEEVVSCAQAFFFGLKIFRTRVFGNGTDCAVFIFLGGLSTDSFCEGSTERVAVLLFARRVSPNNFGVATGATSGCCRLLLIVG